VVAIVIGELLMDLLLKFLYFCTVCLQCQRQNSDEVGVDETWGKVWFVLIETLMPWLRLLPLTVSNYLIEIE
jgi:hypothetical protein